MSHFRPIDLATPYLLPPSVDEWLLPKDHLARFVVDIVEQLDLSAMTDQYRGTGSAPYLPVLYQNSIDELTPPLGDNS